MLTVSIVVMTIIPQEIPTPEPLNGIFKSLGIESRTWAHPPVFRVGEDDGFKHHIPGGHTKNLFLKDKKEQLWLITALHDTKIDLKSLPGLIGCDRVSFGSPERLLGALNVTPGSVTPLALYHNLTRNVRPVLDARMMAGEYMACHPFINDKTTVIASQDLVKFLKNMSYNPLIIDFQTS